MAPTPKPGLIRRLFGWLFSPSAKWSVFALVLVGLVIGAVGVVGTQVAVAVTGTNEFCGTACHSHTKFVYPEYKVSVHGSNRTGVQATCADCHIPHNYPAKLIYKTKAGIRDGIAEMQGTISTQEKFEAKRWEMANRVWEEMRADNSANCRTCHTPESMSAEKQSEDAIKQHKKFASGKATCIDCHTGMAHKEAEEPAAAKPTAAVTPSGAAVHLSAAPPISAATGAVVAK